jgi:hypothetical protein
MVTVSSYSEEISGSNVWRNTSHHPSRECFMAKLQLNGQVGNNDNMMTMAQ